MSYTERIFQLIGTFLPVYGVLLTFITALILKKGWRYSALIFIPLLTLWLCSVFGHKIAYDGNMLYVLLTMVYFAGLGIYYPVLFAYGIVWIIRQRKTRPVGDSSC